MNGLQITLRDGLSSAQTAAQRWIKGNDMELTVKEELICAKYMNVGGKNNCKECPLNFHYGECYATIDGRGLDLKRYDGEVEGVVQGVRGISEYAGITVYQMVHNRDKIGIPYYSAGKKLYAFADELDRWKEERGKTVNGNV